MNGPRPGYLCVCGGQCGPEVFFSCSLITGRWSFPSRIRLPVILPFGQEVLLNLSHTSASCRTAVERPPVPPFVPCSTASHSCAHMHFTFFMPHLGAVTFTTWECERVKLAHEWVCVLFGLFVFEFFYDFSWGTWILRIHSHFSVYCNSWLLHCT